MNDCTSASDTTVLDPSTILRADGSIEQLPPARSGPARRVEHGTAVIYGRGCRCEPCREANKTRAAAWRAGERRPRPMVSARELQDFLAETAVPEDVNDAVEVVPGWGDWLPPPAHRGEDRPFSFDALEEAAGAGTVQALARSMGLKWREYVYRWRARGLSMWEADRLACRLGMHPSEVWADLWWTAGDTSLWCDACGEPHVVGSLWCAQCGAPMPAA